MKRWVKILILSLAVLLVFFGGYCLGKYTAPNTQSQSTTFYAKITSIADKTISVSGLSVNDINYRGKFVLTIDDETEIMWRGSSLELSKLKEGASVSITFSGEILETYPAQIQKVNQISLLDDKL